MGGQCSLGAFFFKGNLLPSAYVSLKNFLSMLGGHTGQRKDATEIRLFITPYTQISHNLQKLLSSIGLNYSKMDGPRDCPAK